MKPMAQKLASDALLTPTSTFRGMNTELSENSAASHHSTMCALKKVFGSADGSLTKRET